MNRYWVHRENSRAAPDRLHGALASIVFPVPEVRVVRDPNDDMIVACAMAAGADYLVTRDEDMLSLDR